MTKRFSSGDRVQLTADFLRSTGQVAGGEGRAKWTVQTCACRSCQSGRLILTNEPRQDDGMFTADEIAREPWLQYRHIAVSNLQKCR